ncbi:MAG TPA: T9SS type A sorting domain-containing protein [Saprospiraceae bacterium]|nr:T9SS type A sorting domain-containing protein [Saprospiraceae bacterium]
MKKLLPPVLLLFAVQFSQMMAQQASCRAKLEVETPLQACSVSITPEMINFGSTNYDQLYVLIPSAGEGTHQVGLVAAKGGLADTCYTRVTVIDKVSPVVILKQSVVVDLGANGYVQLTPSMLDDGTSDNCGNVSMVLSPSALDCDSPNPTTVTVVVYDESGNYNTGKVMVYTENKNNATSALACNDGITVNVGPTGSVLLDAGDILEGGTYKCPSYYQLVLTINNVPKPKPELFASDAGKVFFAIVKDPATGNSCWGTLTVSLSTCEGPDLCDTKANCEPVTDCTGGHSADDNIEWPCDIEADYLPVLAEKPSPDVLKTVLGLALSNVEPILTINECSRMQTTYTDQVFDLQNKFVIKRTWTALNWLSGKVVNYIQNITLNKVNNDQCFICDSLPWNAPISDCERGHTLEDAVEWPAHIIVHSPLIAPIDLENNPEVHPKNVKPEIAPNCNNYTLSYSDLFITVNDSIILVERTWQAFDFATTESYSYLQKITIIAEFNTTNRTVCIRNLNGHPVDNVQLQESVFTTGEVCTSFTYDSLQSVVTPVKIDDVAAGIDIEDASILLDHLLGIAPLDEFQKLAADVNLDGHVTSFDLLTIMKIISGDQTTLDKVWRFFYLPLGETIYSLPLNEQADISSPLKSYFFKAIKMGDLNGDSDSIAGTSYSAAKLLVKDDAVNAGEVLTIPVSADRDHAISGLQVEINKSNGMEILNISSELGLSGTESVKDLGNSYLYSWLANDQLSAGGGYTISKGSPVLYIKFKPTKNTIISDLIHLGVEQHNKLRSANNRPTYLLSLDIDEKITTGVDQQQAEKDWKVAPNPTSSYIDLINADQIMRLDLISLSGQKIKTWNDHKSNLDVRDVNNGIYLLRAVHTDGSTSSKPLYIIR